MNEFIKFIREQGVVGLAVGFILGGAVSKVVSALVEDIIQPVLGVILGSGKALTSVTLGFAGVRLSIGHFLSVLIDFIVVAAVIYWGFKQLKLDRLDSKKV